MTVKVSSSLQDNMQYMKEKLGIGENFDVIYRSLKIGGRDACFYFIDGFTKDDVLEKITEFLFHIPKEEMPDNVHDMLQGYLPYIENNYYDDMEQVLKNVFSGVTALFIDGYAQAIMIDCRTYPARSVDEPEKDRVMRGSRDGFVETLVFNTALLRRRIRSSELRIQIYEAGENSKTDIAICYMKGRVDEKFLNEIITRIQNLKVDALTMTEESLAECLYQGKWINPFPKFRYSERPDTAASSILEGRLIILVDNCPAAMILPATIFDIIEEADDYYFPPVTGTYLRISRFVTNILALFLTPVWLLLLQNPEWIPKGLAFINLTEQTNVPIIIQLLILEFSIDGLRLAALNTPSMLSTPLSVVAGMILGDFAVSSGWFAPQCMLYMAFEVIATYTQSSFELGYALKFMRVILLILTALFNWIGFIAGIILIIWTIFGNKTIAGKSYVYPLFPFNLKQLARRFFRISLPKVKSK